MKIREDRSHMNIDTRWFEKGYAKEDVHSLRLQSLCTEAEAAANKQFYDSHTCEEWEQYIRQASLESSAAMKPVILVSVLGTEEQTLKIHLLSPPSMLFLIFWIVL